MCKESFVSFTKLSIVHPIDCHKFWHTKIQMNLKVKKFSNGKKNSIHFKLELNERSRYKKRLKYCFDFFFFESKMKTFSSKGDYMIILILALPTSHSPYCDGENRFRAIHRTRTPSQIQTTADKYLGKRHLISA